MKNTNLGITSGTPSVQTMIANQKKDYGARPDGSKKGLGYLGEIKRPDGTVMTEVTTGVNIDGKDIDIPVITPYATKSDLEYLKKSDIKSEDFYQKMPKGLMDRAVQHALDRQQAGKPVYAD